MLLLSIGAWAVDRWARRRRGRRLGGLAGEFQLTYSAVDRFGLADAVAGTFPICGAADVRVGDLIYGQKGGRHCYVFTVDYTLGALSGRRRWRQVGCASESGGPAGRQVQTIRLADRAEPYLEGYRQLLTAMASAGDATVPS